jgi:hypothetical protein
MPWAIKCSDPTCMSFTGAANIVDLISKHRDEQGWFLCSCGKKGYIEKSFNLQEEGEVWEPYLKGIIALGDEGDTYQPFVFNVSYTPESHPDSVWFSYYKDLREDGGSLKMGYGPGGPPVLHKDSILELIRQLVTLQIITKEEIEKTIS